MDSALYLARLAWFALPAVAAIRKTANNAEYNASQPWVGVRDSMSETIKLRNL